MRSLFSLSVLALFAATFEGATAGPYSGLSNVGFAERTIKICPANFTQHTFETNNGYHAIFCCPGRFLSHSDDIYNTTDINNSYCCVDDQTSPVNLPPALEPNHTTTQRSVQAVALKADGMIKQIATAAALATQAHTHPPLIATTASCATTLAVTASGFQGLALAASTQTAAARPVAHIPVMTAGPALGAAVVAGAAMLL